MPNYASEVASLLQKLVQIESINPSISSAGSGEIQVAEFLAGFCERHGLPFESQHVKDGRSNFLTWVPGRDPNRRILFVAHMDTVPTDNAGFNPFSGDLRDGRIYGRGSCDDKGSLAAMLVALSTLGDSRPNATVVVAGSVDEEFRKAGALFIAKSDTVYDAAVVGECTGLELVVAHMGSVRWQIEVEGTPAHTSRPELGVNAITGMARVILALDAYSKTLMQRRHPLVGSPALTVSLIEGGIELATVPPSCKVWIDRRLMPGETPSSALDEVEQILADLRAGENGVRVRSLLPAREDPALENIERTRVMEIAERACAHIAETGRHVGVPYGTDASVLAASGIDCVVLGPGNAAQAHTSNEFIELEQLEKAVLIYQQIMREY